MFSITLYRFLKKLEYFLKLPETMNIFRGLDLVFEHTI